MPRHARSTSPRCRAPVTPSGNANPSSALRVAPLARFGGAPLLPHPPARRTGGCVATPLCAPPTPHWSLRSLAPLRGCPALLARTRRRRRAAPQFVARAAALRGSPLPRPANDTATTPARPAPPSPRSVPVRNAPRQDVSGRCGLSRRWLSVAPTPLRGLSATRPAQRPLRLPRSTHCASAHWRAYPKDGQARRSHMLSLSACAALSARRTMWHYVACRGLVSASAAPVHTYRPSRGAGRGDRHEGRRRRG